MHDRKCRPQYWPGILDEILYENFSEMAMIKNFANEHPEIKVVEFILFDVKFAVLMYLTYQHNT